jgi:hypothetical protein
MSKTDPVAANTNRRRPISIPVGGFKSNEQEARWRSVAPSPPCFIVQLRAPRQPLPT